MRAVMAAAAAASLPVAVALAALVLAGWLAWPAAILALALAYGLTAALIARHGINVRRTQRWLKAGDGGEVPMLLTEPWVHGLRAVAQRARLRAADLEAELDSVRAEVQRLVDALPDALFIVGRDARIARANKAARAAFGEGLVGRELATVLRHPALLDAVAAAIAGGAHADVTIHAPGVPERTFAGHVEPLPVAAEGGPALLVVLADRTAAHLAERMRVDFVANASHEIRSPLATLVGFIETLRGPARDDAEARERFLGIMADQADRMTRLVQDLLSLSRIEMNEHTPPSGEVDLVRLAERVAVALGWEAGRRGMTIAVSAEAAIPPVRGDEAELEQVCHNLIGNSIKYADAGTTIAVDIGRAARPPAGARWPEAGAVALAVRDRGPGIAREHIARLTERFYRVDPARSRQMGGTGLGLAIVKHIVNRHRGALAIDSTPGEGSAFTVYLPVVSQN